MEKRSTREAQEIDPDEAQRRELRRVKERLARLLLHNEAVFEQHQHRLSEHERKKIHKSFLRARRALQD